MAENGRVFMIFGIFLRVIFTFFDTKIILQATQSRSKAPSMSSGSEIADTFSSNSYSLTRKMLITRKQKRTLNSWRGLHRTRTIVMLVTMVY